MSDPCVRIGSMSFIQHEHLEHEPAGQLEMVFRASARRQQLLQAYRGEWVAVSDDWNHVYAHGPSYLDVCENARAAGAVDPLLTRLL